MRTWGARAMNGSLPEIDAKSATVAFLHTGSTQRRLPSRKVLWFVRLGDVVDPPSLVVKNHPFLVGLGHEQKHTSGKLDSRANPLNLLAFGLQVLVRRPEKDCGRKNQSLAILLLMEAEMWRRMFVAVAEQLFSTLKLRAGLAGERLRHRHHFRHGRAQGPPACGYLSGRPELLEGLWPSCLVTVHVAAACPSGPP